MTTKELFSNKHFVRWLRIFGAAFLIVLFSLFLVPQIARLAWSDTVYPRTKLGNFDVSNMTREEVRGLLQHEWDRLNLEGVEFRLDNERVIMYPLVSAPGDPDLTYELISLDFEATIDSVFAVGRQRDVYKRFTQPYKSLVADTQVLAAVSVNKEPLTKALFDSYQHRGTPAINARFNVVGSDISVLPESSGEVLHTSDAIVALQKNLLRLSNDPIELSIIIEEPEVTEKMITPLVSEAEELFDRVPFTLSIEFREDSGRYFSWSDRPTSTLVASWISTTMENGISTLTFNDTLREYLEAQAVNIDREPLDAKFDIAENGKISQFQDSRNGLALNITESHKKIVRDIIQNKQRTSELIVDAVEPSVTTDAANDLGIRELIGVGKSDFSGSPRNRRINIQVSSDKLNGLLIPPGDEFSLVETLKPFTAEAGYVPELVIKGSRLIPELGGGACQIGTTTFRAALNAGLDITQRRNHSFAVSYYDDENGLPGTDATIYDPAPDFRFENNTENHILIQTHIGDDDILTYEFWGTSDGRIATTTKPEILASFSAPETKYVETTDLPVGETNCSGYNVPGYNTTFGYAVEYPDGTLHEENFDSYYRPFQRVCLIGVEEISEEQEPVE